MISIMILRPNSIEFYANGNLLTSPKSKINTGMGYLGLIVSSFDQGNVEAWFDNFYVDPIVCGSTTQLSLTQRMGSQVKQSIIQENAK